MRAFSKYRVCRDLGAGRKLSTAGIKIKEIKNNNKMLVPATAPNSFSNALSVSANTANPIAAVMLQNKVTMPIFSTIVTNACSRLPVSL